MTHSEEPWKAAGRWIYLQDKEIAQFGPVETTDQHEQAKAYAARAAECVNALQGIPSEMLPAVRGMATQYRDFRKLSGLPELGDAGPGKTYDEQVQEFHARIRGNGSSVVS